MVKFLNSEGLGRLVSLIKQALGGKQDSKLVVTISTSGTTVTADHTYAEISAAYEAGTDIELVEAGYISTLIAISNQIYYFENVPRDQNYIRYRYILYPNNTWRIVTYNLQQKLTSGTNIKTVNGITLLGSGNITIDGGVQYVEYADYEEMQADMSQESGTIGCDTNLYKYYIFNGQNEKWDAVAKVTDLEWIKTANEGTETYGRLLSDISNASDLYVVNRAPASVETSNGTITVRYTDLSYIYTFEINSTGQISGGSVPIVTSVKNINGNQLSGSGNIVLDGSNLDYTGEERYNLHASETIDQSLDNLDTAIHDLDSIVGEEILTPTIVEHSYIVRDPTASRGNLATSNPWRVEVFKGLSEGENLLVTYSGTDTSSTAQVAGWYSDGDNLINTNYSYISNLNGYAQNIVGKTYLITVPNSTVKALALSLHTNVQAEVKRIGRIQAEIHGIENPNGIESISTTESSVSGGNNTVTITETDGTTTTFNVKNGVDGVSLGEVALVQTTGDSEESVMSQKAVTNYGKKVTAEDMDGTSDWIRTRLTEEGWKIGFRLSNLNQEIANSSCCTTSYIPVGGISEHSITFCYRLSSSSNNNICLYKSDKSFTTGWYYPQNSNTSRTVTISAGFADTAYIRMTCNVNDLPNCYIYDNTAREYIFKGSDLLDELNINNNISLNYFRGTLLEQEKGSNEVVTMSQKAITDAIVDNPIRKSVFNGYYVFENAQSCYSVDTYDIDELKCVSSLWVSDSFSAGPASFNYNLQHILGIVNSSDASNNCLSFYCEGYNLRLRFVKNGTKVLDHSLGSTSGRQIRRIFTMFDFYGKQVRIYLIDYNGTVTTLADNYDFSELDLSNLQKVRIATSLGTSHSGKTMFNHVWINNYAIDAVGQLNRTVFFGQYDPIGNYAFRTKPAEPSSYLFTNESATSGITITLNDPYHKIVEVDRDTAGLVYNWGFYGKSSISNVERLYEICKIKFTNVESNVLLRGWSENGGYNYIINPTTYECTRIPMDSTTETVLEYTVEEGKTYYLLYGVGNGYSTRYNHYIGGHFTMEITEPKLFYLGSMNLCAECYDGKYFCGHIPFYSAGNFVPVLYGQFGSIDYPNLTGRVRIKSGNIQVYNGSVWKQINNS